MGEETEAREYEKMAEDAAAGRVAEWEIGLPGADDLTPLSQPLVPPVLASAFSITPEPLRTMLHVHRASQETLSNLRRAAASSFPPFPSDDSMVLEVDDPSPKATDADADAEGDDGDAEPPRKPRAAAEASGDDPSGRALKRPRLVWTPQLHKRFVDVVAHLGIKQAVPKTIMQLMNVEGLTRENVASHLQKYRLYLKRMQGLSSEGPSSSDHLFASTPVPQSLREHPPPPPPPPPPPQPVAMPYAVPTMIPMSMFSMPHPHGQSPVAMVPVNSPQGGGGAYPGLEPHHHHHYPYGAFGEQPKDWPRGNKFGSFVSYPRLTPNDK